MDRGLRDYEIIVGSAADAFAAKPESQTKTTDATIISGLQFEASINVTSDKDKSSSDSTQITLFNLSKELKDQFKVPGTTVMIRAGYTPVDSRDANGAMVRKPEELPVVYLGTVLHSFSGKRGSDNVTTVFASTDAVERSITKTSDAFPPGTKVTAVIESLVKKLALPKGHVDLTSIKDSVYQGGISLYGKVSDELTRVCEEWNLNFFIHDKKVNIVPKTPNKKAKVEVYDIYPIHLIGDPEGTYERTASRKKAKGETTAKGKSHKKTDPKETITKNGLNIAVHLSGQLKVGNHIRINELADFNGVYRIERLTHSMSYIGGDWSTKLELLPV